MLMGRFDYRKGGHPMNDTNQLERNYTGSLRAICRMGSGADLRDLRAAIEAARFLEEYSNPNRETTEPITLGGRTDVSNQSR